ncbi:hypothetical protein C6502_21715 [Candidatus Poribacteria bacterium]|nr:MAG: hypothetical protein C6502_21715 [Candidatus Poribacteria bacterium]
MINRQSRKDTRKLRIVLSTWGSTGDVQPFLALSDRLLKQGHKVRVCTSEIYRDRFTERGVDFYPVGAPFDLDRLDQAMDAIVQIKNPLQSAILIVKEGILYEADQPYWGCTLRKIGVAPKPLHRQDMTPKRLAKRINQVISSQSMPEKAKALMEKIEMEDGLTTAVRLIEAHATKMCPDHHCTS